MAAEHRHHVRFVGNPSGAVRLVSMVEEQGASVEWTPPREYRGAPDIIDNVVADFIVLGSLAGLRAAIAAYRKRWPAERIEVDGEVVADEDDD